MWALHARYRGRDTRRAELVSRFAQALSTLEDVGEFDALGVEDIRATIGTSTAACDVTMALLAAGDWAIGIGVVPSTETQNRDDNERCELALEMASDALRPSARSGVVKVKIAGAKRDDVRAFNISATFALLAQVLSKRSLEGREATSLVRSGYNQNEAASELGISKQAMSQRLQAAGWHAEQSGWQLAVNLLKDAAD